MNTLQIDWSQCETRMIDSRVNDLPDNIVSMSVEELTPAVLKEAVHSFKAPVQVIQFETPAKPKLNRAAKHLASIEDEEVVFDSQSFGLMKSLMQKYFCSLATGSAIDADLMEIGRVFTNMLESVVANYGQESVNEVFILRDDVTDYYNGFSFHSHVLDDKRTKDSQRAFFLTRPFTEQNTVFVDVADLDESSQHPAALEARFINPCPTIWTAKPGATLLFATKGHEQGPSFHAMPMNVGKRVIPIVNFKIDALTHT